MRAIADSQRVKLECQKDKEESSGAKLEAPKAMLKAPIAKQKALGDNLVSQKNKLIDFMSNIKISRSLAKLKEFQLEAPGGQFEALRARMKLT